MVIKIITGLAGAGKSTILDAFEDLGYYAIDNLPPNLLKEFILLFERQKDVPQAIAIVMDLRLGSFFSTTASSIRDLSDGGYDIQIVFVEADDAALKRRFQSTRRSHPLQVKGKTLSAAIQAERDRLSELRSLSSQIIDSSKLTSHQLKRMITDLYRKESADAFVVNVVSYGVKYGEFSGADFGFDLRFLPNPYYEENLQNLTGRDEAVRDYIMKEEISRDTYAAIRNLLMLVIPAIKQSGRITVTVAFSCTGGRHRSVTFASLLSDELKSLGYQVEQTDRELSGE